MQLVRAEAGEVTGAVQKDVPKMHYELVQVDEERQEVDHRVQESSFANYAMIHTTIGAFRGMISMFGDALSPIQQGIINAVLTVVDVTFAIATSQYSNPYTFWIGIAMSAAATTLSLAGAIMAEQGMDNARGALQTANQLVGTFGGMARGFGR